MCGRITQRTRHDELVAKYRAAPVNNGLILEPQYNGSPGSPFHMVRYRNGKRELAMPRWGLLPRNARSQFDRGFINARCETVHRKPSFRGAFERRRCIVPINGWFEWRPEEGGKQPYWLRPENEEVFAVAGIWQPGVGGWASRDSFAILTTDPAPRIAHIHDRQPVVLDEDHIDTWLDEEADEEQLLAMAQRRAEGTFEIRRVSRAVNDPRNDVPEVLTPAAA